jgi:hypothetical protein
LRRVPSPQVERSDAHHTRAGPFLHPEPPESPVSARKSGL